MSRVRGEEEERQSSPTSDLRARRAYRRAVVVILEWSAVICRGRDGHVTYSAPGLDIGAVSRVERIGVDFGRRWTLKK